MTPPIFVLAVTFKRRTKKCFYPFLKRGLPAIGGPGVIPHQARVARQKSPIRPACGGQPSPTMGEVNEKKQKKSNSYFFQPGIPPRCAPFPEETYPPAGGKWRVLRRQNFWQSRASVPWVARNIRQRRCGCSRLIADRTRGSQPDRGGSMSTHKFFRVHAGQFPQRPL